MNHEVLWKEIREVYSNGNWVELSDLTIDERVSYERVFKDAAADLARKADSNGRFGINSICDSWIKTTGNLWGSNAGDEPECGWLMYIYKYLRNQLFPHIELSEDTERYEVSSKSLLSFMRAVFEYERKCCEFDPRLDFLMLEDEEVKLNGFIDEYIKMKRLASEYYVYEFMRLGAELTPFNTLGHVSGVHYVAMHVARQLYSVGIPVDLGLISAAAATHDIGKYGCRKMEENRVPYLHYYYTDYCLNRFGLKSISHVAANHSTWDLELENLSVESLLLIYADFRTKSSRVDGVEVIHFYSLAEAFQVILDKLDNVDEAKRDRYVRVYNKLKDFEDYMVEHGVHTEIEDQGTCYPRTCGEDVVPVKREYVLLDRKNVSEQIKYRAIDHNIRVMSKFENSQQFASLIEAVRSESDWRKIRTYITILREYSIYMTDHQKAVALKLLYEKLAHQESDIREQAADVMGYIVAKYREEYKKELPKDIPAADDNVTNVSMFRQYIELIINPSAKHTDQHRKWIIYTSDFFVRSVTENCRASCRHKYFDILQEYYALDKLLNGMAIEELTPEYEEKLIVLLNTVLVFNADICPDSFRNRMKELADEIMGKISDSVDLITLDVLLHYGFITEDEFDNRRRTLMGLTEPELTEEQMSEMFLDDLKFHIFWNVKRTNISILTQDALATDSKSRITQIATHLSNLLKVSETITVRKEAGKALLKIVKKMAPDQLNELMLELFNGLERADYQFSGMIPAYLGVVILHQGDNELHEISKEILKSISSSGDLAAEAAINTVAVALENNRIYDVFGNADEREKFLLGILMKGIASCRGSVTRESIRALGQHIFASKKISLDEKKVIASHCFKRILTMLPEARDADEIDFYNNAAALNHIYRYVTEYRAVKGVPDFAPERPAVFFPGTFDPFSLGHKAIATTIRDMGFDVFLAIDEFSWSKKTLPHLLRKNIVQMSTADEECIYIFPDDITINIAYNRDLKALRELFADRELYIAVGSDVVKNASAYKNSPDDNSIHSFNHIIFQREAKRIESEGETYPIEGKVIELTLDKFYEDISSTKIRDNIDLGRDISDLIDLTAQNYIYDNNLYIREPAYMYEVHAREMHIRSYDRGQNTDIDFASKASNKDVEGFGYIADYLSRPNVSKVTIEIAGQTISAAAGSRRVRSKDLLNEFSDVKIASTIRNNSTGEIAVIGSFYVCDDDSDADLREILLTELMTSLIAKDCSYAVYHPAKGIPLDKTTVKTFAKQGFVNISDNEENPVYAVDLRNPIVLFRDADTVVKAPLNENKTVKKVFDDAHENLMGTLRELYPNKLILSFNTSAVYSKIVDLVALANGVSIEPDPMLRRGPYLAVPFGKAMSDVLVPNTVTKCMRTEKYFSNALDSFDIRESRDYTSLVEQAHTLQSFNRPVILIDDLLHSGQRMDKVEPILTECGVEIHKVIVGILTGNARDKMQLVGRDTESAYFLPSISMWINERDCYPFIGGDSIDGPEGPAGKSISGEQASINLIMPYTGISFMGDGDPESVCKYSITCLENAHNILRVLEQEYQNTFEKKLTLARLGAVLTYPRKPLLGEGLVYDDLNAPSTFIENEIRRTKRLFLYGRR